MPDLDHRFTGPSFTLGIEEELMICDAETYDLAQGIEQILEGVGNDVPGEVKPELMQSVLEVATSPCANLPEAAAEIDRLRGAVGSVAAREGMSIGAAGTHPFARWEDQRITDRSRYHELVEQLGWIARQELIFGVHVHVGIEGPEKAVYIADGMRGWLPLLLAWSANSPFWRGENTGMMSARTPIFRHFPRNGVPPYYGSWEVYSHRVELMVRSGAIPDYTYLWWDVRPHPNLGTVEMRVFDQQTRVEHTIGFAALTVALAHKLSAAYDEGVPSREHPRELIDDNKVRAALTGLEGELIDFERGVEEPAAEMARRCLDELREHAEELGCAGELASLGELIDRGTGARRQLELLGRHNNVRALVAEIVHTSEA